MSNDAAGSAEPSWVPAWPQGEGANPELARLIAALWAKAGGSLRTKS
jgi:hypothetical protein